MSSHVVRLCCILHVMMFKMCVCVFFSCSSIYMSLALVSIPFNIFLCYFWRCIDCVVSVYAVWRGMLCPVSVLMLFYTVVYFSSYYFFLAHCIVDFLVLCCTFPLPPASTPLLPCDGSRCGDQSAAFDAQFMVWGSKLVISFMCMCTLF